MLRALRIMDPYSPRLQGWSVTSPTAEAAETQEGGSVTVMGLVGTRSGLLEPALWAHSGRSVHLAVVLS